MITRMAPHHVFLNALFFLFSLKGIVMIELYHTVELNIFFSYIVYRARAGKRFPLWQSQVSRILFYMLRRQLYEMSQLILGKSYH